KILQVSAVDVEVVITAPTIRLAADDCSYIRIVVGVEIGSQGKVTVHASKHAWNGPKTELAHLPTFGPYPAAQQLSLH
ncbi:DUF2345 domain-containing protein, partial [Pseudomonas syringae group genomosp. 7]|uniref:DUF2345 domain-containing protein n=1 Tax=Pseudomonas syringae group genomosp. 7 TaxID=251699 RepID=UPI00376F54C9